MYNSYISPTSLLAASNFIQIYKLIDSTESLVQIGLIILETKHSHMRAKVLIS